MSDYKNSAIRNANLIDDEGLKVFWSKTKQYIDAVRNDAVIDKGDAKHSAVLKGEYEGYSNKAISQTSMAVGGASNAGLKGWYYSGIDFTNNKIYLSKTQPNSIKTSGFTTDTLITLDDIQGPEEGLITKKRTQYIAGDSISIVCDKKYENQCKITSVEPGIITVDKIPFTSDVLPSYTLGIGKQPDDFTLYSIMPEVNSTTKQLTVRNWKQGGIDLGAASFAEGANTYSTNIASHAEGIQTVAYGQYSHAEGFGTKAGYAAHAEGKENIASGESSHAEGLGTISQGSSSHAEGCRTKVDGVLYNTISIGVGSHAEGMGTTSSGSASHSEGYLTVASGSNSHAEGKSTKAIGPRSHSEGNLTTAEGNQSHSEGYDNHVYGNNSHAEGSYNTMLAIASHIEGSNNTDETTSQNNHIEGNLNLQTDSSTETIPDRNKFTNIKGINHVEGAGNVISLSSRVHVEGSSNIINNVSDCHIEGRNNTLNNELNLNTRGSHVEGYNNKVCCNYAHAQGKNNIAFGEASFVTGIYNRTNNTDEASFGKYNNSTQSSNTSRATHFSIGIGTSDTDRKNAFEVKQNGDIYIEGVGGYDGTNTDNSEDVATVINDMPIVKGDAENSAVLRGGNNSATGDYSYAEGADTTASGHGSHAEGLGTTAEGSYSHAEGRYTRTNNLAEHASGQYNKSTRSSDTSEATQFSIGIGTSLVDRKNAFEVKQNGDIYIEGVEGRIQDRLNDTSKEKVFIVPEDFFGEMYDEPDENGFVGKIKQEYVTNILENRYTKMLEIIDGNPQVGEFDYFDDYILKFKIRRIEDFSQELIGEQIQIVEINVNRDSVDFCKFKGQGFTSYFPFAYSMFDEEPQNSDGLKRLMFIDSVLTDSGISLPEENKQLFKKNMGSFADWNAQEGEAGYIENKPCFSLKTVNSRLDNLNPYFNTDFENGKFYPKHDLYVEYENKTIFMCKKDTELYYGDGIIITDDNENYIVLDGDSETGEICCVGDGGYDFELIFSLDKKYIGFQSTEDTTVTPDWNAEEGEAGYIENRTHYSTIDNYEFEVGETGEDTSDIYVGCYPGWANDAEPQYYCEIKGFPCNVKIISDWWDNKCSAEYTFSKPEDKVNVMWKDSNNNNYHNVYFHIDAYNGKYYFYAHANGYKNDGYLPEWGPYTVIIENLKQINEKYIPSTIAKTKDIKCDWNAKDDETGYIKNKPCYEIDRYPNIHGEIYVYPDYMTELPDYYSAYPNHKDYEIRISAINSGVMLDPNDSEGHDIDISSGETSWLKISSESVFSDVTINGKKYKNVSLYDLGIDITFSESGGSDSGNPQIYSGNIEAFIEYRISPELKKLDSKFLPNNLESIANINIDPFVLEHMLNPFKITLYYDEEGIDTKWGDGIKEFGVVDQQLIDWLYDYYDNEYYRMTENRAILLNKIAYVVDSGHEYGKLFITRVEIEDNVIVADGNTKIYALVSNY